MTHTRRYWTVAGAMIAIVAVVSLGLASTAGSHLRDGQGRWYFRGFTAGQADGSSKSDPVNVLFYRGGPVSLSRVDDHIHAHAALADVCQAHVGPVCVAHCPGSAQYLTFVNLAHDRASGAPATRTDEADLVRETSCADDDGESRHHIRIWDDLEHSRDTRSHGALDQWAVGAIHEDLRVSGEHIPGEDWEASERWLLRKMRAHCQYPHWRVLPGSTGRNGRFRGLRSDGYVSLITLTHTSPGHCPAG